MRSKTRQLGEKAKITHLDRPTLVEAEDRPLPMPPRERLRESPFLSRREVSQLFGVSASTVTRWARLGLLKVVRTPGGHYRFPSEETRKAAERASTGELTRLD